MSQPGEDDHKELERLGWAIKMAWWRYGVRIGLLGMALVTIAAVTGNRYEGGWWDRLPRPWGTVTGWTFTVLFFIFLYQLIRGRPGKQPCRRCNAPFRKITFVNAHTVGSMDQIVMRCEACGHQWLWEGSP